MRANCVFCMSSAPAAHIEVRADHQGHNLIIIDSDQLGDVKQVGVKVAKALLSWILLRQLLGAYAASRDLTSAEAGAQTAVCWPLCWRSQ